MNPLVIAAGLFGLVALWVAFPAGAVTVNTPGEPPRPKVCLVLSGGGARGAAHVGVIKVLEEYRIPIDCIVGTSMGSLVGAAYATGTTVSEMERILASISTELLFKEQPPRREQNIRRKQDDNTILLGPEFGVSHGKVSIGKGLVSGVQLETVLRRLSKVKGFHHFDDLPIQFRAMATNLVTGASVEFSEGELANVMRASMSVPGAVAPADMNGMLLVDGMLTANLPVEAARALGADIIIAVNVGTPLLKREQLNGILGVSSQMLSILTEQNVQRSLAALKPTDILISPDLGDYSTGDFDSLPRIEPLGDAAARKLGPRLAALSLPPEQYAALRARQSKTVLADLRPVDEVRFEHLKRVNPEYAQSVIKTHALEPIEQHTLDLDMRRLYGTGDFEHVNYRFMEEPARRVLTVDAVEKAWGPDYLRFGLGLSSDFSGDAYFNFLTSYRRTWLNSLGAEWRTDAQIGRTNSLNTEFYQPLDAKGQFFVAPHAGIERRSANLYRKSHLVARYDISDVLAGVDVGTQFSRWGELRLGVVGGSVDPKLDTGPSELTPGESHIRQGAYVLRLLLDQLDSAHFPREGWRGSVNVYDSSRDLGAQRAYTKWDADGSASTSFGNNTFTVSLKFGGRLGDAELPRYDQFQWGGFLQQSGYATGQLVGQRLRFARLMYYRRLVNASLLEGVYGGVSLEAGEMREPLVPESPDGLLKSTSIFLAADSPVGPVYLGYGHAWDGNSNFYFFLGVPY